MTDSYPDGAGSVAPEPAVPVTDFPPIDTQPAQPAPPRSPRRRRVLIATGVAAGVLVAAGAAGAYVAYDKLAAHGDQPEKALPSGTVAMVKVDFDPAAAAKLDLYHLAKRFPALAGTVSKGDTGQSVKDKLVSALLSQGGTGDIDYATDVKPWLGNRVALAAVPDAAAEHGVDPVLAVQVRDQAKMTSSLTKIKKTVPDFGYAVRGEYVLISSSQAAANHAIALDKKGTLASNPAFTHDLSSLPGHQLAAAWADEGAVLHAVGGAKAAALMPAEMTGQLTGRVVLGLHTTSTYAEISGATYGAKRHASTRPVDSTIANLPADTDAAVSVAGLATTLTDAWSSMARSAQLAPPHAQIRAGAAQIGLNLPADIPSLLGTVDTVAVTTDATHPDGAPNVGVLVTTSGADRAVAFLSKALQHLPFHVARTDRGYVAATSAGFGKALTAGTGAKLGASSQFRHAVPDAAGATAVGFVNLHHLIQSDPTISAKDRANLAHLSAVGVTAHPTAGGSTFTVRLTTQ